MGKGGGGPTQTTSTVQNTNVPEYARPYVETMLGATQEQLFQGSRGPSTTDPSTGETVKGEFNITGFKPYQAYGGTYDSSGNQTSYDPGKAIAGFQPMQEAAQRGVGGMDARTQDYNYAQQQAINAGAGAGQSAQQAMGYGAMGQRAGMQGQRSGMQGQNIGIMGGANYGQQGAGYGQQAAQLSGNALGYGQNASDIGMMGLGAQGMGQGIANQAQSYGQQAANAGNQYAQQATNPYATQAYMSPYMQNVVNVQNQEAMRNARIVGAQQQAEATRAGAFGGSRDAIMRAERERNLATMMNQNQAQGLQSAFQQAQQAQQFGANLGLQGLQGAQQGLGTALQGGQLGLSGVNTALQGQQGAMAGVGQAGAMYGLGMQGAQTGLQGVNAQLAGTAQGMQGAGYGLQGAQSGLAGVQGAQAGYGLQGQQGMNYANMLGQQQQNQLGLYGAQSQFGAQQQALEQQKINQAMQDYANAQQYPLMQLGTMSNMLRGLPMQASSTQQYQAAPNQLSQAIGTIGAGASIYNAFNPSGRPPGQAAGGEVKGYAKGGIMSYDMGGEVEAQLENMDEKGLEAQAKESSSPSIRRMAQRILRERKMSEQGAGASAMGVQYQAPQPQMPGMRSGGIIAFAKPTDENNQSLVMDPEKGEGDATGLDPLGRTMEQRLAMPPASGIMGASPAPAAPAPAPAKPSPFIDKEAMTQRDLFTAQANRPTEEVIKEIQADRQALGVDTSAAREQYRAQQMAERANMKDEQERQRHLRLAEFFASWGSTPGPTLVAGMNALKQSIPGIVSDEKEAKKARREADKIIFDIDEATRLEKLGLYDKATALKEKAAGRAEDYNKYLLNLQAQREGNERAIEAAKIQAKAQTDAAAMRNASDAAYRTQTESNKNEDRIYGRYLASTKEYNDVVNDVARQESQDAHKNDLKNLNTYTMGAVNKKTGEIDVSKISPSYKAPYAETLERVNKRKEGGATAISDAKKEKDTAYTRYINLGKLAAGPKVTPTDSGAGTTGEFKTPNTAQINALKTNPEQAAAFDAKFGPGAAAEYLGK